MLLTFVPDCLCSNVDGKKGVRAAHWPSTSRLPQHHLHPLFLHLFTVFMVTVVCQRVLTLFHISVFWFVLFFSEMLLKWTNFSTLSMLFPLLMQQWKHIRLRFVISTAYMISPLDKGAKPFTQVWQFSMRKHPTFLYDKFLNSVCQSIIKPPITKETERFTRGRTSQHCRFGFTVSLSKHSNRILQYETLIHAFMHIHIHISVLSFISVCFQLRIMIWLCFYSYLAFLVVYIALCWS